MFGLKRFHVSASGAIQGHHGPVVVIVLKLSDKEIEAKGTIASYKPLYLLLRLFNPLPDMTISGSSNSQQIKT